MPIQMVRSSSAGDQMKRIFLIFITSKVMSVRCVRDWFLCWLKNEFNSHSFCEPQKEKPLIDATMMMTRMLMVLKCVQNVIVHTKTNSIGMGANACACARANDHKQSLYTEKMPTISIWKWISMSWSQAQRHTLAHHAVNKIRFLLTPKSNDLTN